MKDWTSPTEKVVGSLTHQVVGNISWDAQIDTVLKLFIASNLDASSQATFQSGLVSACQSLGPCK